MYCGRMIVYVLGQWPVCSVDVGRLATEQDACLCAYPVTYGHKGFSRAANGRQLCSEVVTKDVVAITDIQQGDGSLQPCRHETRSSRIARVQVVKSGM